MGRLNEIDFVILWVDGNDPEWIEEYHKYIQEHDHKKKKVYYRDWDNLQYIFRAFEVFTPWVRKIHFVTWGHLPVWLNTEHPKLNIVNHSNYIDRKYLPAFNANPLEINLHRITELAEQFVFFNDDFFITSPLLAERFFKDGLPCDMLVSNALTSSAGVGHFVLNNLEILNRHFDKKLTVKSHIFKWFNLIYGKNTIRNIALLPWPRFTGFIDPHMPQAFLKSTFEEVWDKEKDILEQTSASKFRSSNDVNQYLFRYWQLAKGNFQPISFKDTTYEEITVNNIKSGKIEDIITAGKYSMICLNDSVEMDIDENYERAKGKIKTYFEKILPKKSSFENE